jgi:hypothetical protein
MSKWLFVALLSAVVILIPWTVYIAITLPDNFNVHYWSIAWVGFDIALILILGFAAWAAYFQRQIFIAAAIVAATLLICDAWFDVVTSLGTKDEVLAIAFALLIELPIAAFFILLVRRIMKRTLQAYRSMTGDGQTSPRIRDATLL